MVFVSVHTPWPTSKGLDHSYLHVYAWLLLCFMLMLASLVLGFAMLDALRGFVVVWLHPTPMRSCSDVTIWEASPDVGLLRAYPSVFRSMLVCATSWLSMHLYTLAYMSMHESCLLVCRPYFSTIKLWTSDPNLHLSLVDTTLLFDCSLVCLFACLLATLLVCLIAYLLASFFLCLPYLPCLSASCLYHVLFASFPSITCLLVSCLCLYMYTHRARMRGARAQSPRHK